MAPLRFFRTRIQRGSEHEARGHSIWGENASRRGYVERAVVKFQRSVCTLVKAGKNPKTISAQHSRARASKAHGWAELLSDNPLPRKRAVLDPPCGGPRFLIPMRYETTPPPAPNWEKHLEPEVSAQIVTGCEQTQWDLQEYAKRRIAEIDPDPENDGLEVVK